MGIALPLGLGLNRLLRNESLSGVRTRESVSDSGAWTRVRILVRIRVGDSVSVRVGQGYVFGRNQET